MTIDMPLKLEVVTNPSDFDEVFKIHYASFGTPYNALRQWFIPVHTTESAAIETYKQRNLERWKENDGIFWLRVVDTEKGGVVGIAEWAIHRATHDNEREEGEGEGKGDEGGKEEKPFNATWHKDGSEEQRFANRLLPQLKVFMGERMGRRAHIELEGLGVHPDARGRGIGKLLINWGIQKSDELGLEACIESVPFAVPFYEKCGFGTLDELKPDLEVENPSGQWKKWAGEDLRVLLCWRPVGRDFDAERDGKPWLG